MPRITRGLPRTAILGKKFRKGVDGAIRPDDGLHSIGDYGSRILLGSGAAVTHASSHASDEDTRLSQVLRTHRRAAAEAPDTSSRRCSCHETRCQKQSRRKRPCSQARQSPARITVANMRSPRWRTLIRGGGKLYLYCCSRAAIEIAEESYGNRLSP